MLISVFLNKQKGNAKKIFCSDNQILDWLWRVVLFVLMVWQRFPDAAELNILTIKPTSTQFGPRPIFQDLLSSKDFLSMWNWEFYRKDLFSWFIVIFFSFLGLIPLVILIFLNLRILSRWIHFLHILPPSYSSSSMLCSFLILPETTSPSPSLRPWKWHLLQKLEEPSLPTGNGEDQHQQQLHHRFDKKKTSSFIPTPIR